MRRGEVWWADLPDGGDAGPGFRRPVLVVQADAFNQSLVNTVLVVPFTSNLRLAEAPGNVLVRRGASGLDRDSVANVSQVLSLPKAALTERVESLPRSVQSAIDAGLRRVLAL
jgi:mRNA interferase MazF